MRQLKRFEIAFIVLALSLVGGGIWGLLYGGFSSSDGTQGHEAIGAVVQFNQSGEIKRHFNKSFVWKSLAAQSEIYEKDTVYVGSGSSIQVRLVDNTTVSVGEDSLVVFERAKMLKGGMTSIYLVRGQMDVEGENVTVNAGDQKSLVASNRSKFSISKRNKKVAVTVAQSSPGSMSYRESEKVVKELTAAPEEVVVAEYKSEAEEPGVPPENGTPVAIGEQTPTKENVGTSTQSSESDKDVTILPPPTPTEAAAPPPSPKSNKPELIAVAPENDVVLDALTKFPAVSFRFHMTGQPLHKLALQVSGADDFTVIPFQTQLGTPTRVKREGSSVEPSDLYETKLSGAYLVLNEPFTSLAYASSHDLYWRVQGESADGTVFSKPMHLKFQVNDKLKMVTRVGESSHPHRTLASAQTPAILWSVEGRLPTHYRISFYADSQYETKICSETIRSAGISQSFTKGSRQIDSAELVGKEEFIPNPSTLCKSRTTPYSGKEAYYRVEALNATGTPLATMSGSQLRGRYPIQASK